MRAIEVCAGLLLLAMVGACASRSGSASGRPRPTDLRMENEEVPAAVRAIETVIDQRGALVAEEVEISVSRNYEWDVSLTGNDVSPHGPSGDGAVSVATGNPRATFRNLDIRAYQRIVFRKSGFGVVPFIRIEAKGRAIYVEVTDDERQPRVRRANLIRIENAAMAFLGERAPESVGIASSGPADAVAVPSAAGNDGGPSRGASSRDPAPLGEVGVAVADETIRPRSSIAAPTTTPTPIAAPTATALPEPIVTLLPPILGPETSTILPPIVDGGPTPDAAGRLPIRR